MEDLTTYMAALTLYENNMRIIHWKLSGSNFHTTHERFGDYYEELGKYMDETAEQMITLGLSPLNTKESMDHMEGVELDAFTLSGSMDFDENTAEIAAYRMMKQLYDLSSELAGEDDLPIDVQDVFMGHAKYFRIEGLYKLGRRIEKHQTHQPGEHDDDD